MNNQLVIESLEESQGDNKSAIIVRTNVNIKVIFRFVLKTTVALFLSFFPRYSEMNFVVEDEIPDLIIVEKKKDAEIAMLTFPRVNEPWYLPIIILKMIFVEPKKDNAIRVRNVFFIRSFFMNLIPNIKTKL